MKIAEYKQMMEYLTRPGFNGGGSVRNKTVLPKKKPEEEVKKRKIKNFEKAKPALENPKEVKKMIDKPKRGLVDEPGSYAGKSAAERQREYRERNPYKLKTTDIVVDGIKYTIPNNAMKPESAKGLIKFLNKLEKNSTIENYGKLVKGLSKDVANQVRNYRYYLQGEKKGSFAGEKGGENLKKLFEELNLPKQSTNLLSKITSKDIKGQVVKTATKAAGETAKSASMDVVNAVRDIFVKDVNNAPSLDDIAEGLEGSSKWNAASDAEKIKMRTNASNATKQFLEALTGDRKVKGFKDIAPETLGDIVQYIDDNKRGEFRFAEGLIRDYKIKLRDSLIKGDFGKQRRNISGEKGKVIDEVFGLSATYENAPGYTENIQIISDKVNKLKRTQIDKPFAAILKAVKEGRDTVTFDKKRNVQISEAVKKFNLKSKVFSKVNKVSSPLITVGDNLDATKLVSNFNKYSPQAQQNIKQLAKDGFVLTTTKPSTPVGAFSNVRGVPMSLGATGDIEMAKNILKKDAATAKNLLSKGFTGLDRFLLRPLTAIEAPAAALPQSAFQAGKLIGDVKRGEQTDVKGMDITLPTSLSSLAASKKFGLDLFADNAGRMKKFLRAGLSPRAVSLLSRGSVFATPVIETGIQGYNARQDLLKAREKYGTDDMVVTGLGMAPREYVRDLAIDNQKFEGQGLSPFQAAGGGIAKLAGKSSGPAPESGPTPQGLDFLMKRGR